MRSRIFGSRTPEIPHLVKDHAGGLGGEVADLRADVEDAFQEIIAESHGTTVQRTALASLSPAKLTGTVDLTGLSYPTAFGTKSFLLSYNGRAVKITFSSPGNAAAVLTQINAAVVAVLGSAAIVATLTAGTNFLVLTTAATGDTVTLVITSGNLLVSVIGFTSGASSTGNLALTTNDAGHLFWDTTLAVLYSWTGTTWQAVTFADQAVGVLAANATAAYTVAQLSVTNIESSGNASGAVTITAASYVPGMTWVCRNNNTGTSATTFFGITVTPGYSAIIRINSAGAGERVTPDFTGTAPVQIAAVLAANATAVLTVAQLIGATAIESSGNAAGAVTLTAASYVHGLCWVCRNNNTGSSVTTFFGVVVKQGRSAVVRINGAGAGERVTPDFDSTAQVQEVGVLAADATAAYTLEQLMVTEIESATNAAGTIDITAATYVPGMQWVCRNNNTGTSTTTFFGVTVAQGSSAIIRINSAGVGEVVDIPLLAPATNGKSPVSRGSQWYSVGVTQGADLTDANITVNASGGIEYWMPSATMTVPRVVTLGVAGANVTFGGPSMVFIREDGTANTLTFLDDAATPVYVSESGVREIIIFKYDKDLAHYEFFNALPISA